MSSSADRAPRGASIARPIFLLVIASVLVTTIISFFVTFSGPPPFEPPRSIRGIAAALRGEQPRYSGAGHMPGPHFYRTPLRRFTEPSPPKARKHEHADPSAARRLAAELGVPAADVVALTEFSPPDMPDVFMSDYSFAWRTPQGWQVVRSAPRPFLTRWHIVTLLSMLAAIAALSIPAWLIVRAITRPLRQLARAADQAGTGADLPPLPGGSLEVRDLARAVTTMHRRLANHAEGRTAMLAGIAHDLGTPLSRLAFRTEHLPEAERTRAAADIEEMRAMIQATLAFTRDEAGRGPATRVDLGSLLDSLVDDMADAGAPVAIVRGPRAIVRGDSMALRRMFGNLVENAIRYGGSATVGWSMEADNISAWVDDVGPGIDPAMAERLFQPFVRGEPSRNRATGGTGLGLAIVRSIATAHGGAATLENIAGGARARIVLPLSD